MITNKSDEWDTDWLDALQAWAQRSLGCVGRYSVVVPAMHRRYTYKGKAQKGRRRVKVYLHRQYDGPRPGHDPRLPELWSWLDLQGQLKDNEEMFVWILGHELWHCEDPFSCQEKIGRRSPKFVEMERRCDEAGFRLVELYRRERGQVLKRADQIRARAAATVGPAATGLAARLGAARVVRQYD